MFNWLDFHSSYPLAFQQFCHHWYKKENELLPHPDMSVLPLFTITRDRLLWHSEHSFGQLKDIQTELYNFLDLMGIRLYILPDYLKEGHFTWSIKSDLVAINNFTNSYIHSEQSYRSRVESVKAGFLRSFYELENYIQKKSGEQASLIFLDADYIDLVHC